METLNIPLSNTAIIQGDTIPEILFEFDPLDNINLGEYNVTKASGEVTSFYTITPIDVTIPDGYIVTYFLKRLNGTAEVNVTTHFHFKNI